MCSIVQYRCGSDGDDCGATRGSGCYLPNRGCSTRRDEAGNATKWLTQLSGSKILTSTTQNTSSAAYPHYSPTRACAGSERHRSSGRVQHCIHKVYATKIPTPPIPLYPLLRHTPLEPHTQSWPPSEHQRPQYPQCSVSQRSQRRIGDAHIASGLDDVHSPPFSLEQHLRSAL